MGVNRWMLGMDEETARRAAAYAPLRAARAVAQERGRYRVSDGQREQWAECDGVLRCEAERTGDFPAVGDFVMLDGDADADYARIRRILPRRSAFMRRAAGGDNACQVVAANVDLLLICMALNEDFNLRRLERYLSIGWDSGATPVVVLTKTDLCANLSVRCMEVEEIAQGADVLTLCALSGEGCAALEMRIGPGVTAALIGSSGAGKSTLVNRLLGERRMAVGDLRADGRGRHTTTGRQLLQLPGGGMLIDTPGMRELGMWDAQEGIRREFADIEALAERCRFRDCTHEEEPGCAVRAAIRDGRLSEARWRSCQKLRAEAAFAHRRADYNMEKQKKFREIAQINRHNKKR